MSERSRTSPLENIPPVAKIAESAEYTIAKLWDRANLAAKGWPKAMEMLQKNSKLMSAQTRVLWHDHIMALAATGQKGNNQLKRLAPFRTLTHSLAGKVVIKGLGVAGGAVTAFEEWHKSTTTTMAGKIIDTGLAGGAEFGLGYTLAAPIDTVARLGFAVAGVDSKGWTVAENVGSGIRAIVTSVEAGVTGDYRGVAAFDEKARSGGYGPPAQALADLGADVGRDGVGATLAANIAFYWHGCRITH